MLRVQLLYSDLPSTEGPKIQTKT